MDQDSLEVISLQKLPFSFDKPEPHKVQSLAVLGLMSVQWSPSVSTASSSLRVALLDLDQFGVSVLPW